MTMSRYSYNTWFTWNLVLQFAMASPQLLQYTCYKVKLVCPRNSCMTNYTFYMLLCLYVPKRHTTNTTNIVIIMKPGRYKDCYLFHENIIAFKTVQPHNAEDNVHFIDFHIHFSSYSYTTSTCIRSFMWNVGGEACN